MNNDQLLQRARADNSILTQQVAALRQRAEAVEQEAEAALRRTKAATQERDAACQRAEAAEKEAEAANQRTLVATQERDAANRRAEAADRETEAARQELDAANRRAEAVMRGTEVATQERDAANQGAEAATKERDAANQRAEAAEQEAETVRQQRDTANRMAEHAEHETEAARQHRDAANRRTEAANRRAEAANRDTEAARQERDAANQRAEAANRRTVAVRQERDAANQRSAAAEQRSAAAERRAEAAEQLTYDAIQLNEGTYYTTIDKLWTRQAVRLPLLDYNDLCRRSSLTFYGATVIEAIIEDTVAANDKKSARSSIENHHEVWPCNIFGSSDITGQIAHLLPASPAHASMWVDVATLTLGLSGKCEVMQKAIHGSRLAPLDRAPQALGQAAAGQRRRLGLRLIQQTLLALRQIRRRTPRLAHTGLKHSRKNMIRLNCQKEFFDTNPCLLIVPIMTLDQVRNWTGQGYEAIVLAGEWTHTGGRRITAGQVYQGIKLLHSRLEATSEDIELARKLLAGVAGAMAYSLFDPDHRLPLSSSLLRIRYRLNFPALAGQRWVWVPSSNDDNNNMRVSKIVFHTEGEGHPCAPDPMLLSAKSAIVWSTRNHQPLKAAGEAKTGVGYDNDNSCIKAQVADREYLRRFRRSKVPLDKNPTVRWSRNVPSVNKAPCNQNCKTRRVPFRRVAIRNLIRRCTENAVG